MQTSPPPPLFRNDQIYMNDAHSVETKKSILRFLFFELWSIMFSIFKCVTLFSKYVTLIFLCQWGSASLKPPGSWGTWPTTLPTGGSAVRTQAPDTFGLNSPSQLVFWYHWLAFLNQICKNQKSSQFTTNVEYKIDHISKTKNRNKKKIMNSKTISEHCASQHD